MVEARFGYRPFPEQQAHFRRKINLPSARWDDLMHGDHAHGFMVAGLARMDVLDDIRQAVQAAIDGKKSFEDFRKDFERIVKGRWEGFTGGGTEKGRAWRARMIYQTNMRTSYMAGRWEALQNFPYLQYRHRSVNNPRHEHQAWDDKILPTNDPWWDAHYPPNGWGCRCTVNGISAARLRAMRGEDAEPDTAPEANPKDPPPEWRYHVGKSARSMAAAEKFGQKVMTLPPQWRKAALDDAQERMVEWFKPSWTGRVERAWQEMNAAIEEHEKTGKKPKINVTRADGAASPIGFLTESVLDALNKPAKASKLELPAFKPASALVSMTDHQIYHSLREAKGDRHIVRRAVESLPDWIRLEDTLLYREGDTLHFARKLPAPDSRYISAVLRWNEVPNKAKEKVAGNWLITVKVVKGFSGIRVR